MMNLVAKRKFGNDLLHATVEKRTFGGDHYWFDVTVKSYHSDVCVIGSHKMLTGITDEDADRIAKEDLETVKMALRRMLLDE